MSPTKPSVDPEEEEVTMPLGGQDDFLSCCERWDREHAQMKAKPPQKPTNNYVKHARNLLPLLESVAELHPVAKAVVFSFRAVVEFQHDRIENDVRVYNVLLTASDVMRWVLQIYILTKQGSGREIIESNLHLQDQLRTIANDITDCGNAIDTYYKEHTLTKFLKAKEWKETVADLNQRFAQHRVDLTQALSVRTAFGVDDLHAKLDTLYSLIFSEREHERKLQQQIRQFGISQDKWIQDPDKLKKLYEIIRDDPMVDLKLFEKDEKHGGQGEDKDAGYRLQRHMAWLKEEVDTDIKSMCARNKVSFMKKMDFQTSQIQEAISISAAYVVGQLSGPYDRLKHADLKILWKEMNWLFCVESKVFAIALYEYYLDLFSTPIKTAEDGTTHPHRDSWTLDYFSTYGEEICNAVDTDSSGYIRISEVNAFTEQIPKGWSLPEWCVYHALGWHYEQHLYQKRLLHLLDTFYEAQAFVTPWNRWAIQGYIGYSLGFIHNLARGPRIRNYAALPVSMLEQVRNKVEAESQKYRGHFVTFHGQLDSSDTVKMIYRSRPLEAYILQLCVFVVEWCLDVADICRTKTVDLRQWDQLEDTIDIVRLMTLSRIGSWEVVFRDKQQDADSKMDSLCGGLYRICFLANVRQLADDVNLPPWGDTEIRERLADSYLLSDIPWPPPDHGDLSKVLTFPTWEDSHPEAGLDAQPPVTWPENEEECDSASMLQYREDFHGFPCHLVACSNCQKEQLVNEPRHTCLTCEEYELCQDCFRLPFESLILTDLNSVQWSRQPRHIRTHHFLKQALSTYGPYYLWLQDLARYTGREIFKEAYYYPRPDGTLKAAGSKDDDDDDGTDEGGGKGGDEDEDSTSDAPLIAGWDILCDACRTNARSGRYFAQCLHALCLGLNLCQDCAEKNDFPRGPHSEKDYLDNQSPGSDDGSTLGEAATGEGEREREEHGDTNLNIKGPPDDEGKQDGDGIRDKGSNQGGGGEQGDDTEQDGNDPRSAAGGTSPPPVMVFPANQDMVATKHHRWWHTMVVIPLLVHEPPEDLGPGKQAGLQDEVREVNERLGKLEVRMQGMEENISRVGELLLEILDRLK